MFTQEANQSAQTQQRHHPRIKFPLVLHIDGQQYLASDWSKGGFQVKYFDSDCQVGDCLPISLGLSLKSGIKFSLDVLSEVVWRSQVNKATGFRFLNLRRHEKELLQSLIQDVQSGDLTTEHLAFNNQNPLNAEVFRETAADDQSQPKDRRFWLTTSMLSLLSLGILSATGVGLYRAIAFMHIDSAAIARSFEEIISTHRGQLSQLYISEGMAVEAGQPLFRVYDEQMAQFVAEDEARNIQQIIRDKKDDLDRLQRELSLTQAEQEKAQAQLEIARSRQEEEVKQLGVSRTVTEKQLAQAQAKVTALETQYETAQKSLHRAQFLLKKGAAAEERVDRARERLADVEGELKVARKEVDIKQDVLATIDQGSFYTGERFNGNLPQFKAAVAEAKETLTQTFREIAIYQAEIQRQQQEIATLEQQYRNQEFQLPEPKLSHPDTENIFSQVYDSPVDGTVVQIRESAGESIQIGETLLVLQPNTERPMIDAFFTQDQAARLAIGQVAKVTLTDFHRTYQAKVTKIDRSGGLRDEIRGRYQFEGSTTRPAYVQLEILDATTEDEKLLTPGTPLEITVRKENWFDRAMP